MALQVNTDLQQINEQRINKVFNDLQFELDKQKKSLIDQTKHETNININQQKYNNIIENLKDLVTYTTTATTNNDSSIVEMKQPTTSQSEQNITEIHTMDHFSAWIKNKQLWQYIDKPDIDKLQNDIINNIFGGFKLFIDHLLDNQYHLSVLQQNKLYHILSNHSSNSYDIFHNYHTDDNNDKISITSIPDQCLSYIMQFLTQNNRYMVQQTCRLFAISIRQEGAVNNVEKDFNSMKMIPNMKIMIENIASHDKDRNKTSLEIFAKYMHKNRWILANKLKNYDQTLWHRFQELVLSNDSELNMKIALFLFHNGFSSEMFEIVIKYLQNLRKYSRITKGQTETKLPDIIQTMRYSTFKLFHHKELIPTLMQLITNKDSYSFKDKHEKRRFVEGVYHCIGEVAKFGVIQYNQQLIDQGFMDNIRDVLTGTTSRMSDERLSDYATIGIWNALAGFLDTPGIMTIDQVFEEENSNILNKVIKHPNYSAVFLIKIFRIGTHEQRMDLIKQISSKRGRLGSRKHEKVLTALKDIGDMEAYDKFSEIKHSSNYWEF